MSEATETNPSEQSERVQRLVIPVVPGHVTYDVRVTCPHCNKSLHLNQYPYSDGSTEYSLAEDELGLALFGTATAPPQWDHPIIEFKCCGCKKIFRLNRLEI